MLHAIAQCVVLFQPCLFFPMGGCLILEIFFPTAINPSPNSNNNAFLVKFHLDKSRFAFINKSDQETYNYVANSAFLSWIPNTTCSNSDTIRHKGKKDREVTLKEQNNKTQFKVMLGWLWRLW